MPKREPPAPHDRRTFLRSSLAAVAAAGVGAELLEACASPPAAVPTDAAPPDRGRADAGSEARLEARAEAHVEARVDGAPARRPTTTVRERIVGALPAEKQPDSTRAQWGVTKTAHGDPHLRNDLLNAASVAETPSGPPASLLYLAHLTDVHIIDEESPARTINLDKLVSPAWRAQESHSAWVLDAMMRKLHAFDAFWPLDLVLFTGDCIENNQKNELAWFLKLLEGGPLHPNSGDKEDPVAGPDNDPHDAFDARGLGAIPWLAVMGNHDALIQGNLPHGLVLDYSIVTGDPTRGTISSIELGRVNPPTCNPLPTDEAPAPWRCIPSWPKSLQPGSLPPDKERRHLKRAEWLAAVAAAGGKPKGHGFGGAIASSGDGDFVLEPVAGSPLRLVVLNTCSAAGAQGSYSDDKIVGFLASALKQAAADEALVVVASHHPSSGIPFGGGKLRQTLNSYPNVVLHLVGHEHANEVILRPGASPQHGYWEVQTSALAEWPQQARLIELVDRRDGTADIWLTLVDYETGHLPAGPIAAGSRFLALREIQSGAKGGGAEGKLADRNVILPVALSAGLRKRLAALPARPVESELFAI